MYFTPDWNAARVSLRHLADYAPSAAITGHGPPMRGERLQTALRQLASHFDEWARPAHGRYRDRPAITDVNGVVDLPPPVVSARTVALTGLAIGVTIALAVALRRHHARAEHALAAADDQSLLLSAALAAADGGYDATTAADTPIAAGAAAAASSAGASPSFIDLR
jgi:hypothetical protein